MQKHLVLAEMLSNQISARLIPGHFTQIHPPPEKIIKRAKGQGALRALVFRKFWSISSNLTLIIGCPRP